MENFTPVCGLVGGLLIGLAVALLLVLNGRIGGISGIVGGLLAFGGRDVGWRARRSSPAWCSAPSPTRSRRAQLPSSRSEPPCLPVVVGGLLVGFGARLGPGCTSGHGLCGLARFSRRSVVATAVFFCVAMVTVFFTRHVL